MLFCGILSIPILLRSSGTPYSCFTRLRRYYGQGLTAVACLDRTGIFSAALLVPLVVVLVSRAMSYCPVMSCLLLSVGGLPYLAFLRCEGPAMDCDP
ncbi:hypothetical protein TNCV_3383111 [Trichonephila clavipes]|nr:hypothetical protein TNCV_3383111 [Trichonephila clavipes]